MRRVTAPPVVQDVFTSSPITDPILEIPQVSISYFENTLLPPLHGGLDTDAVLSELKKSGAIDGARWQLLLHESPSPEAFSDNNYTIKSLNAIAAEVAACARQILAKSQVQWRQTVEFLDAFTKPMPFHANKVALTADGYALLVQPLAPRRNVPHWDDIVVAGIKIYAPKEDTFDVSHRNYCHLIPLLSSANANAYRTGQFSNGEMYGACHGRDSPATIHVWIYARGLQHEAMVL